MKKIDIKKKLLGALVVSMVSMMMLMPITAFAQSDENEEKEAVEVSTEAEKIKAEKTEPEKEESETKEPMKEKYGPLTPDGNMSLVDDYGSIEAGEKQFITVVTKSGNYFYIIIDRDDQGQETVHFLNMVDESDLLKLMDDEEAKAYIESISDDTETVPINTVEKPTEEAKEETTERESEDVRTVAKSPTGILVLVLITAIGGIGGYIYLKGSKKKNIKGTGPDPDADYSDEEEDYLADLDEDDDDIMNVNVEEDSYIDDFEEKE